MIKELTQAVLLLLSITLPRGTQVPVKHIREAGGAGYVERVTWAALTAAAVRGAPLRLYVQLLIEESQYRETVTSFNGTSKTIAQLNTRGRYYRAYKRRCRAEPHACLYAALDQGAAALAEGVRACNTTAAAVGWYRSGRCIERPRDQAVALGATRLPFPVLGAPQRVAQALACVLGRVGACVALASG